MFKLLDRLLSIVDKRAEAGVRKTAQQYGRRSFLAKAGVVMIGSMAIPLLPFDRSLGGLAMAASGTDADDEHSCEYWRHCATCSRPSSSSTSGSSPRPRRSSLCSYPHSRWPP